jgi:DNA-binding PadR family transcriptional regulator
MPQEQRDVDDVDDVEALLPLTPAVFHILLALCGGELHGYAIMREIEASTQGRLRVGPGTLYRSIKQMLAQGLIVETEERPDPELDDERRRYYRLSDFGQRVAAAEARRLARLVAQARERRLLDLPGSDRGLDPRLGGA